MNPPKYINWLVEESAVTLEDGALISCCRSNDFTEIIVSDLLEFIHGYTVPRCKQWNRSGKN